MTPVAVAASILTADLARVRRRPPRRRSRLDHEGSLLRIQRVGGRAMIGTGAVEKLSFESAEALARHVAAWLCALAEASDRRFAICLSGGATPRRLYETLAGPELAPRFPWQRVHWFWGDERFVPHDDADSNYRMASEALLSRAPVPGGNIHAIPTVDLPPQEAAAAYDAELKRFYGAPALSPARPLFDVTFLGIGDDGHTASLFPGQPALAETQRWVTAVLGAKSGGKSGAQSDAITSAKSHPRITLTYPALDSSRDVAFLATGAGKRDVVARAQAGDRTLPAALVRPVGRLHWFTDHAAAGEERADGE